MVVCFWQSVCKRRCFGRHIGERQDIVQGKELGSDGVAVGETARGRGRAFSTAKHLLALAYIRIPATLPVGEGLLCQRMPADDKKCAYFLQNFETALWLAGVLPFGVMSSRAQVNTDGAFLRQAAADGNLKGARLHAF